MDEHLSDVVGCNRTAPVRRPGDAATSELLPTRPSLLARLRNRDDSRAWHRGWEEFFLLYHPVIYRHALKWGLREADAEDVVQEIVIGVARRLPQFHYDTRVGSFKTWLFTIARNKIVDHLRRRARRDRALQLPAADGDEALLSEFPDPKGLAPDQEWDLAWEANLRRAAIERVTRRVNPMTMRLYLYHVVDGHSAKETVSHFRDSQVSAAAVHLAKHRVQKMLNETIAALREGRIPL